MEQTIKDIRSLRITSLVMGVIGGLAILFSLLVDSFEVESVVGSIGINSSATLYLSSLFYLVIAVGACGIIFTIIRNGIANIVLGILSIASSIFMYSDIRSKSDNHSIAVHIGPMVYLMIIGGVLLISSGIVIKVAKTKIKEAELEENMVKFKKYSKIAYPVVALICAACIALTSFSFVIENKEKNLAKETVNSFLTAAINSDYATMTAQLDKNVDDKNGFMEAYTPGCIGGVYLSVFGLTYDSLSPDNQQMVTEMEQYFSKSYLKSFRITDVKGSSGEYTITANATILKFQDDNSAYEKGYELGQKYVNGFANQSVSPSAVLQRYLPDLIGIMNESITDAGQLDTEFTFKVQKDGDNYLITEIDYKD